MVQVEFSLGLGSAVVRKGFLFGSVGVEKLFSQGLIWFY